MEFNEPPRTPSRSGVIGSALAAVKNYFTPERNDAKHNFSSDVAPLVIDLATPSLNDSDLDSSDSFLTSASRHDDSFLSTCSNLRDQLDHETSSVSMISTPESETNQTLLVEETLIELNSSPDDSFKLATPNTLSVVTLDDCDFLIGKDAKEVLSVDGEEVSHVNTMVDSQSPQQVEEVEASESPNSFVISPVLNIVDVMSSVETTAVEEKNVLTKAMQRSTGIVSKAENFIIEHISHNLSAVEEVDEEHTYIDSSISLPDEKAPVNNYGVSSAFSSIEVFEATEGVPMALDSANAVYPEYKENMDSIINLDEGVSKTTKSEGNGDFSSHMPVGQLLDQNTEENVVETTGNASNILQLQQTIEEHDLELHQLSVPANIEGKNLSMLKDVVEHTTVPKDSVDVEKDVEEYTTAPKDSVDVEKDVGGQTTAPKDSVDVEKDVGEHTTVQKDSVDVIISLTTSPDTNSGEVSMERNSAEINADIIKVDNIPSLLAVDETSEIVVGIEKNDSTFLFEDLVEKFDSLVLEEKESALDFASQILEVLELNNSENKITETQHNLNSSLNVNGKTESMIINQDKKTINCNSTELLEGVNSSEAEHNFDDTYSVQEVNDLTPVPLELDSKITMETSLLPESVPSLEIQQTEIKLSDTISFGIINENTVLENEMGNVGEANVLLNDVVLSKTAEDKIQQESQESVYTEIFALGEEKTIDVTSQCSATATYVAENSVDVVTPFTTSIDKNSGNASVEKNNSEIKVDNIPSLIVVEEMSEIVAGREDNDCIVISVPENSVDVVTTLATSDNKNNGDASIEENGAEINVDIITADNIPSPKAVKEISEIVVTTENIDSIVTSVPDNSVNIVAPLATSVDKNNVDASIEKNSAEINVDIFEADDIPSPKPVDKISEIVVSTENIDSIVTSVPENSVNILASLATSVDKNIVDEFIENNAETNIDIIKVDNIPSPKPVDEISEIVVGQVDNGCIATSFSEKDDVTPLTTLIDKCSGDAMNIAEVNADIIKVDHIPSLIAVDKISETLVELENNDAIVTSATEETVDVLMPLTTSVDKNNGHASNSAEINADNVPSLMAVDGISEIVVGDASIERNSAEITADLITIDNTPSLIAVEEISEIVVARENNASIVNLSILTDVVEHTTVPKDSVDVEKDVGKQTTAAKDSVDVEKEVGEYATVPENSVDVVTSLATSVDKNNGDASTEKKSAETNIDIIKVDITPSLITDEEISEIEVGLENNGSTSSLEDQVVKCDLVNDFISLPTGNAISELSMENNDTSICSTTQLLEASPSVMKEKNIPVCDGPLSSDGDVSPNINSSISVLSDAPCSEEEVNTTQVIKTNYDLEKRAEELIFSSAENSPVNALIDETYVATENCETPVIFSNEEKVAENASSFESLINGTFAIENTDNASPNLNSTITLLKWGNGTPENAANQTLVLKKDNALLKRDSGTPENAFNQTIVLKKGDASTPLSAKNNDNDCPVAAISPFCTDPSLFQNANETVTINTPCDFHETFNKNQDIENLTGKVLSEYRKNNKMTGVLAEIHDNVPNDPMGSWLGKSEQQIFGTSAKTADINNFTKNEVFSSYDNFDIFNTEYKPPTNAINRESLYVKFDPFYEPRGALPKKSLAQGQTADQGLKNKIQDISGWNQNKSSQEKLLVQIESLKTLYIQREQNTQAKEAELMRQTADVERKYKEAEAALEEKLKKEEALQNHLALLNITNPMISDVSMAFDQFLKREANEPRRKPYRDAITAMTAERDFCQQHLKNAEDAFVDVMAKFNRLCESLPITKANNKQLENEIAELQNAETRLDERIHQVESSFVTDFKELGSSKNAETEQFSSDLARITAQLRKAELYVKSTQESLDKILRENEKLASLCDELVTR